MHLTIEHGPKLYLSADTFTISHRWYKCATTVLHLYTETVLYWVVKKRVVSRKFRHSL